MYKSCLQRVLQTFTAKWTEGFENAIHVAKIEIQRFNGRLKNVFHENATRLF